MGRFPARLEIRRRLRAALADVSRRDNSIRTGAENHHRIFSSNDERHRFYYGADFNDLGFQEIREGKSDPQNRADFFYFYYHRSISRRRVGFDRKYSGNIDGGASVLDDRTFNQHFYFTGVFELNGVVRGWRQNFRF